MELSLWLVGLFCINVLAYMLFGMDKARARAGEWRIAEAHLLFLALAGGWLGAKVGQRRFRHKTRKEPFRTMLNLVPCIWIGLLMIAVVAAGDIAAMSETVASKEVHKPPVRRFVSP